MAHPAAAQDEALVDVLADVLAAEDARRWDLVTLREAANHPDRVVRRHAALAIGRIGDNRGTRLVLRLIADVDTTVALDAVFALGLLQDTSGAVIDALRPIVLGRAGADPDLRRQAITATAKIGSRRAIGLIRELFDRPVPTSGPAIGVLGHATGEMWRLGTEAPITDLARLANSSHPEVRKGALYSLFRLRNVLAAGTFLGALADPDPEIRGWAALVLTADYVDRAELGRRAVSERIEDLLTDANAGVRVNALRAIATYQDVALAPGVLESLVDRDPGVVATALTTLAELDAPGATDAFLDFVGRGRIAFREPALVGLARTDRMTAIRTAAAWIQSTDWVLRASGARALAELRGDTAAAWLVDLTRDPDLRVAAAALEALQRADSGRARVVARDFVGHREVRLRARALAVLGRHPTLADADLFMDAFAAAQSDREPDVGLVILDALGRLFDSDPEVAGDFFARFPSHSNHVVRRAARLAFPDSVVPWRAAFPIETDRTMDDYRQIVRRFLLPGERGELPRWELDTERGRIEIDLYAADAPIATHAFFELTEQGYFEGGRWHRVVHNFGIQAGDPHGDGSGGPGYTIRDELSRRRWDRGVVGLATSGPDTGGSQFFITQVAAPHLDGSYTVFGKVRSGMGVVDETTQGDRLRSARVRR